MEASPGVELRGVTRRFANGAVPFEQLDLHVRPGEFLAVLGPSGCGKSTLLRLIAGLDQPQAGEVWVHREGDGDRVPARLLSKTRGQVAYVFQDAHLLPWRTVYDNVSLPLELMNRHGPEARSAVMQAIEQVGLADAIARYPSQLSGGMRMRASLARAMVTRPRLLLLDEPFAALDEITRYQLDRQLRDLWTSRRMTIVFVTHSTTEATFLADRAVVMGKNPGRIVADIAIDLPAERDDAVRGSAEFARQTQLLFDAFVRGGALR